MITKSSMPQTCHDDFASLIDHVDCGFVKFINDNTTTILYANHYFFQLLGYTRDEYLEKFIYHFSPSIHPEDYQKFKNMLARQRAMGNSLHFEYRAVKKDGSLVWIRLYGKLFTEENFSYYCCLCLDITDSKISYQHLAKAKFELDMIANNLPGGVVKLRFSDFKILYSNDGFYKLAGYSRIEYEQKYSHICMAVLHPDDNAMVQNKIKDSLEKKETLSMEYRIIHKSGQIRWSYLNGSQIETIDDAPIYLCIIVDITKQKEYEAQLMIAQKTNQLLCEFTKETNWEYNIASGALTRFGKIDTTYSENRIIFDFINYILSADIIYPEDIERCKHAIQSMKEGRTYLKLEVRLKNYVGIYTWYLIQGSMVFDKYGTGYKVIGKTSNIDGDKQRELSVTENQFALQSKFSSLAVSFHRPIPPLAASYDYDSVTGLISFSHFMDAANNMIRNKKDKNIAVIAWDMNRFKKYNLTYGFTVGNQILKMLADAVIPHLKPNELFSRIHSDHFIICVTYESIPELTSRISQYRNDIALINEASEPNARISISCGIYLLDNDDYQIAEAIDKADSARKSIKKIPGPHNYVIYSPKMDLESKEKNSLSEAFLDAFDNDEFILHYQPIYNTQTKKIITAEALIRWQRPGNKLLYPKDFFFLLDNNPNGVKLDFFVIEEVCKQLRYWLDHKYPIMPIAINISGTHPDPVDFCNHFHQIAEKYKIDASYLTLELDETQFFEEPEALSYLTKLLQQKGYKITLSYFQKYCNCFQLINDFHIDAIKFDVSLFKQKKEEKKEHLILKKLLQLVKELDITLIAKNIETSYDVDLLKDMGCNLLQGTFYYEAIPPKDFAKFILKNSRFI